MRWTIAALALCAAPAFAQAPLDKVYACAGITDNAGRLSCYDAAIAGLKKAQAGGDVTVMSKAQVQKAEADAFGARTPTPSALAASAAAPSVASAPNTLAAAAAPPPQPQPLDKVTLAVKAVETMHDDTFRFTMENGQVWRQIDHTVLPPIGKGPWTAEIRKTALGGYMLKLDGRTAMRVERQK